MLTIRKSNVKARLAKRGRDYIDEDGEIVSFVRDVAPAEPYKLWVKQ